MVYTSSVCAVVFIYRLYLLTSFLDNEEIMVLWIGSNISPQILLDLFGVESPHDVDPALVSAFSHYFYLIVDLFFYRPLYHHYPHYFRRKYGTSSLAERQSAQE